MKIVISCIPTEYQAEKNWALLLDCQLAINAFIHMIISDHFSSHEADIIAPEVSNYSFS